MTSADRQSLDQMARTALKWIGIGLLVLIAIVVLFLAFETVRLLVDPSARD
jgi:cell division protein FtsX